MVFYKIQNVLRRNSPSSIQKALLNKRVSKRLSIIRYVVKVGLVGCSRCKQINRTIYIGLVIFFREKDKGELCSPKGELGSSIQISSKSVKMYIASVKKTPDNEL